MRLSAVVLCREADHEKHLSDDAVVASHSLPTSGAVPITADVQKHVRHRIASVHALCCERLARVERA
jgi:hypothetical protein